MQLDPAQPLGPQMIAVSSSALEQLTAAACASVGYTVFRGLIYELSGHQVAEVDVFASVFTPWRESRILFECKGGHPSFEEIRKFASLRHLLLPEPDDLIILTQAACPATRKQLAELLDSRIVEKTNLTYYVLPLIGGAPQRKERAAELNRYLAWQLVHDFFVARVPRHQKLKMHYRFLITRLWTIGDPIQQTDLSFDGYKNLHADTSDVVAQAAGTTANQAIYDAANDDVESSFYVVLLHRVMNVYAVVRHTLFVMQHRDSAHVATNIGYNLRGAISALSSNPRLLFGFPAFLQTFFFVWGGFIVEAHRDAEVRKLALETSTTPNAIELYLDVLDAIYTGVGGASMFYAHGGVRFFKYVPAAFRALGMAHRRAFDQTTYGTMTFFANADARYSAALDRALMRIGGRAGLRY